jgi:hypothetical protein
MREAHRKNRREKLQNRAQGRANRLFRVVSLLRKARQSMASW